MLSSANLLKSVPWEKSNAANQPIGIYDSGVGGLTVLKALRQLLPQERFIYFADTAHLPYGNKTKEQILGYTRNIIAWFQDVQKVKLVVAACHTSSALALEDISSEFEIPIVGTINPILRELETGYTKRRIGVIATPASAANQTHRHMLAKGGFQGHVHSIACPDFVPLIESGCFEGEALRKCARLYLEAFQIHNLDTLIYGCTHYPFIKETIQSLLPSTIQYIDPADYTALEVREILQNFSLLRAEHHGVTRADLKNDRDNLWEQGELQFHCSSDPIHFDEKLKILNIPHNQDVSLTIPH